MNREKFENRDNEVRERLSNWAEWQSSLINPSAARYPSCQPMFKECVSGYNIEDDRLAKNRPAPNVDDAEFIEALICRLNSHDQQALVRYFIFHKSTDRAARKMGMSRRQFERWLNVAVGKVSAMIDLLEGEKFDF